MIIPRRLFLVITIITTNHSTRNLWPSILRLMANSFGPPHEWRGGELRVHYLFTITNALGQLILIKALEQTAKTNSLNISQLSRNFSPIFLNFCTDFRTNCTGILPANRETVLRIARTGREWIPARGWKDFGELFKNAQWTTKVEQFWNEQTVSPCSERAGHFRVFPRNSTIFLHKYLYEY